MAMRPTGVLAAAVLLAGLTACANQPAVQPTPAPAAVPSDAGSELTALPACPPPPPASGETVEGMTAPEGTIVTKVEQQDPLTNVTGYVPMTPVQFETSFRTLEEVTILLSENEVYEAELLITNGTHRTFFKATATCKRGSSLLAVVAPEVDADGLPLPQRATATPAP